MADFVITSYNTTARSIIGGEDGYITKDGELVVSGSDVITGSGSGTSYMGVNGSVVARGGGGFEAIQVTTEAFVIQVGPNGYIATSSGETIDYRGTFGFWLINHGTIESYGNGVIGFATDPAIIIEIVNHGTIAARLDGLDLVSGTLQTKVFNTGLIASATDTGIRSNVAETGGTLLQNSGTITGEAGSYRGGDGADIIFNSGLMDGDIDLDDGNDQYDGSLGRVRGTVDAGTGNDTVKGGEAVDHLQGGSDDDTVLGRGGDDLLEGGFGNDFILGGAGNDEISGGQDNDTLNGNSGDDTMLGNDGNDILVGQDGSDNLDGGDGLDTIDGGNGDDVLEGGDGNDILRGRAGEDELAGGLGRDFLTGGQDADQFVFRALAETVVGANRDQILDFEQGVDSIVVAGLSPGVFEFRGTGAFAPSGNPELRLVETATGSTIVQFDANGDGAADAEIRVAGVTGLTADDFVL
ncbi:hypothetical protein KU6B_18710 [Mameliella alba]|uniref:calcium-binding protein n=1 Tax=Mameliella alba TaxID=561184 RepID=UPI0008879D7B|nr:calcium-binding protein [Mameliella alba]OWV47451.1 hypothetical protein CDZ96_13305 [Mameliella alba]PTR38312.1 hemolysin type calcium-binding protein [Mameliella alba]SDC80649.1 Hemolysin-type calcium-binding repeat-containing protein [Mameliella alba]BBU55606.1 hypothetical protein KU6B_18710 [Mameliella alba]GGF58188.1 hypothetical protein GCM10011319_19360 [Mameliella alba]